MNYSRWTPTPEAASAGCTNGPDATRIRSVRRFRDLFMRRAVGVGGVLLAHLTVAMCGRSVRLRCLVLPVFVMMGGFQVMMGRRSMLRSGFVMVLGRRMHFWICHGQVSCCDGMKV